MDHQFKEDCKTVPWSKIPKENITGTYLIFITSLPEDEQTSKNGGGGRYDAILEFKGEQIKKIWWERKKERNEKERKKEKNIYEKKRKNMSMCKNKNKVNSSVL
jgi:hypothetical protein